jgi:hypothetical protein
MSVCRDPNSRRTVEAATPPEPPPKQVDLSNRANTILALQESHLSSRNEILPMVDCAPFPLPFKSLRVIAGKGDKPFIVGAMFTNSYSKKAVKLAASCEKFALPYVLYEVSAVHRSISIRGTADLACTKANFVHHLLETHKKPVLYVDADCEFVANPELITELANSRCDFAIYNWLPDDYTEMYSPIKLENGSVTQNRFFSCSGGFNWYSTTQLGCFGAVQFYRNSLAARALLSKWHQTVARFPNSADDACMNFTYNNIARRSWLYWLLKAQWLPKAYARYAHWIYAEPVINHADFPSPASNFVPIRDPDGRSQFYVSLMTWRGAARMFPPESIIDAEKRMICRLIDGEIVPIVPTGHKFWV